MFTEQDRTYLRDLHIQEEGCRIQVYVDTEGHPSIGIGFNLDRGDAKEILHKCGYDYDAVRTGHIQLTFGAVLRIYWITLGQAIQATETLFGSALYNMPRRKALVLVDMMFQLGPTRFGGFKRMIAAVRAGDWPLAARELMDSRMAEQCPYRCERRKEILEEP